MNAQLSIYADRPDEVAESFIGRMLAPQDCEPELFNCFRRPWWQMGICAGLVCGVVIGLLAFLLIPDPVSKSGLSAAWAVAPRPDCPQPEPMVAKSDPQAARRMISLGWKRYRTGQYRKASVAFGRAVHLNPDATGGYYGLAISLFEQGHNRVALQMLKRASGKRGGQAQSWVLLGAVYQWAGQEKKARRMYRRYLRRQPRGKFARDVRSLLARERLPALSFPDID